MSEIEFPVLNVKMVDIDKVIANDYNPNKVAPPEMELLRHSIEEDGYTQPIVTYYDKDKEELKSSDFVTKPINIIKEISFYNFSFFFNS